MKMNIGKMVDKMTQGSCIPTDSLKSRDDYSNPYDNFGTGKYIELDKTNPVYLIG